MTANLAQPFARYCFTTVIVMFVAGLLQFSETPGLVQVRLLPPAGPDTVSVPSQLVPSVRVRWYVNAPEKLVVVRVPPTVPLRVVPSDSGDFHVPLTLARVSCAMAARTVSWWTARAAAIVPTFQCSR